jgi:chromosome segregation ATPase
MQVQLDEVRKENVIIKRTNTQLTGNLEDEKTHLVEIQLNLESSHTNDSSVERGGETEILKLKIEAMEVELEDLKNINEFNDEILHHKEDDLDKLAQKCEDLSQLISQLMTLLEFMNRELNELKITTEGFDTRMNLDQHRQGRETVLGLHQYMDLRVRRWGIMMRLVELCM